jgi:hypothetical protein
VRAYTEGVAALKNDKNGGLKVVAKYSRYTDPRFVESQYSDSSSFLDRVPRVEKAAVAPILEFIDQRDVSLATFADNAIIERLVKEVTSTNCIQKTEAIRSKGSLASETPLVPQSI